MEKISMNNINMKNTTMENITNENTTIENTTTKQILMENDYFLSLIKWEIAERLMPATIILYVLILIGIIGNIAFIVFFVRSSKCTPPTFLITCLAVADLGTCFAAIPVVSEMIVNVGYSLSILCKVSHFFGLFAGGSACFVLWLISIDRYRKICYPLAKQLSLWTVKVLVFGVASFTLLLALRYFVTYSSVQVELRLEDVNQTVTGFYCKSNSDYALISLLFYSIDFLLILMIWMTVVVTYSRIIYAIVNRRHAMTNSLRSTTKSRYGTETIARQNLRKTIRKEADPSKRKCNIELDDVSSSDMKTDETEIYTIESSNDKLGKLSTRGLKKPTFEFSSVKRPSEVKLTLMMCAVSMIFILCFTPYFVVRIFIRIVYDSGNEYDYSAWLQFALKLPYLNSACNPVIYYIFNPNFRRFVISCCRKCRCYSLKKTRANFKIVS